MLVVAWSPDGVFLTSGDMDGKVWLWKAETGEPVGLCKGHQKWISSIVSCESFHFVRKVINNKDTNLILWLYAYLIVLLMI